MIASLEGIVTEKDEDNLVVSLGAIGLRVFVTRETATKADLHKSIGLYTNLVVREDSLTIYGFETKDEKEMFVLLLSVSGIGPRTALAAVSSTSFEVIKKAVINEQPELLSHIPGVGKKTARSIILQLQGKLAGERSIGRGLDSDVDSDVIAALTGLGYSIVEAQTAIQMMPDDTPKDLETRVRTALKYFS